MANSRIKRSQCKEGFHERKKSEMILIPLWLSYTCKTDVWRVMYQLWRLSAPTTCYVPESNSTLDEGYLESSDLFFSFGDSVELAKLTAHWSVRALASIVDAISFWKGPSMETYLNKPKEMMNHSRDRSPFCDSQIANDKLTLQG